ncbi:MAG TPA: NAD(P)/FAD-dependent oxidoreductase [Phycisphaerales bacterium]
MSRSLFARLHDRFERPHQLTREGLSRRAFLASLAAASAAGLSWPSFATDPKRPRNGAIGNVLVLGAGLAGLACSLELCRANVPNLVIDARGVVGGRVRTIRDMLPGLTIEAGGEYIGANHPRWLAFASEFKLKLLDAGAEDESGVVHLLGRTLSEREAESLYHEMDEALAHLTELARPVDADRPWQSPNAAALDERTLHDWLIELDASPLCKHAIATQAAADNGVEPHHQSLLAVLAMIKGGGLEKYWTDSELFRCAGGNDQLAMRLWQRIGEPLFHLGTRVHTIRRQGDQFVALANNRPPLFGTHLVLALPPSAWKSIRFEFDLPELRAPIQMGSACKWIAAFKNRDAWATRAAGNDLAADRGFHFAWNPTLGQDETKGSVLTFFAGADVATMFCALDAPAREAQGRAALASLAPAAVPAATRTLDWPNDALTGAGYGVAAPCQWTGVLPGLVESSGPVYFAGEWCSPAFMGYMEGALESGVRAARRVVESNL